MDKLVINMDFVKKNFAVPVGRDVHVRSFQAGVLTGLKKMEEAGLATIENDVVAYWNTNFAN